MFLIYFNNTFSFSPNNIDQIKNVEKNQKVILLCEKCKSSSDTQIHFYDRKQRRNLTRERICHFIKVYIKFL